MHAAPGRARLFDAAWFIVCLTLSSCWCWTAARQLGATFDEPVYIARGLDFWHTGSHRGLMVLGRPCRSPWTLPRFRSMCGNAGMARLSIR